MSIDPYYGPIKALLEKNGAMGVNALQKELNIPLSTLQRYLDKQQNYFKKNISRKWVLPEEALNSDNRLVSDNYTNIIDNQISGIEVLLDTVIAQFRSTLTLMNANKPQSTPVADNSTDIHPLYRESHKKVKLTYSVFKKYVPNCPEEYQDLLLNLDIERITIEMGTVYMNGSFSQAVSALFTKSSDELPDDILKVIEEYQKE